MENISVFLGDPSPATAYLTRVDEITTDGQGANGLDGHVQVNAYMTDSIGSVTNVNTLTAITQQGDVTGPISCVMHPGSDPKPGSVNMRNSFVALSSSDGSLTGDVFMAPSPGENPVPGIITDVDFRNGTIGTSATRVDIHADGAIGNVVASAINADIGGTSIGAMDAFVSFLGVVNTSFSTTGTFNGEIRADKACASEDYYNFGANFTGPWRFGGAIQGRLWLRRLNYIGSTNEAFIAMPPDGLEGTVSFLELEQEPVEWARPVAIKSSPGGSPPTEQNSQHYFTSDDAAGYTPTRFASELGGGAVGVVPFLPHPDDFNPKFPNFAPLAGPLHPNNAQTDLPITIRYYGPVRLPASGRAFTVEARLLEPSATWFDATSDFPESLNTPGTAILMSLGHRMPGGYEYRVTSASTLYCDLPDPALPDQPVVAFPPPFDFHFQICDEAPYGDADSNGVVNFADITSVLANFDFAGHLLLGDADKNDVVNFADITSVLTYWNFTYCATSAQSFAGKHDASSMNEMDFADGDAPMSAAEAAGTITAALQQMGYASIESFSDAVALMSEEERNAEVRRLGELLQATP